MSSPWWCLLMEGVSRFLGCLSVTALSDLQLTARQLSGRKRQEGDQVPTFIFPRLSWMLQTAIFPTGKLTSPCLQTSFHSYPTDKCDDSSCLSFQTAWKAERFMNLLILKGIINGSHQASMLCNIKTHYLCSSKQARVRGDQRCCQQQKWDVLQDCAARYHSCCMSFVWTFLAARLSQAILTGVFHVGHQGAAALHVVLYNWVASTFHKPILGLTKSWAEGQLPSRNVPSTSRATLSSIFSRATHTHFCFSQPVSEALPHSISRSS